MANKIENIASPRAVEFAREYLKRGYALIPVEFRGKKPIGTAWQKKYVIGVGKEKQFEEHNVGFILGKPSDGLTDIDLDCDEAIELASCFLPETAWVFGHKSARRSHYMYQCDESRTIKFMTTESDRTSAVMEIRSTGGMTVAPGSIHPSDEPILFANGDWKSALPAKVEVARLDRACGNLAAACLVLRHGWKDGKRDEVAVALCGVLLRAGRSEEDIDQLIGSIADVAGDEEHKMRLKASRQAARLRDGEKVPGVPSLVRLLGKDVTSSVLDWLGVKDINTVIGLNLEIAYVTVGGKARIVRDGGKYAKDDVEFMSVQDCRTLMAGKGQVKLGKKVIGAFDHWLASRERREYRDIVFKPAGGCNDLDYNLWTGWPVNADVRGEAGCSVFLSHVLDNICSGDQDLYDYVMTWLADAVQNPCLRPSVALVLQGDEGNGKTMFAEYVLDMFGKYGIISTNQDHLFSRFNSHLSHKLMVFADESCWAGNRHHESVLKNIISGDKLSIEPKGVGVYELDNYVRLIMATNADWAVPVGPSARRFCVIRMNQDMAPWSFFDQLATERARGGAQCLLSVLREWKLGRQLRLVPKTEALLDNKLITLANENPIATWWHRRLRDGETTRGSGVWEPRIEPGRLYRDYLGRSLGGVDKSSQTSFGIRFKRLLPALKRIQTSSQGVRKNAPKVDSGHKRTMYLLPTLETCREYFRQEILRVDEYDWEGIE